MRDDDDPAQLMPQSVATKDSPSVSRNELRAKLRGKIRDGRQNRQTPSNPRNIDLGGELLRRGIDDLDMLNMAKSIGKNPQQAVSMLRSKLAELEAEDTMDDDEEEEPPPDPLTKRDESDDEGLPPPARS